MSFIKDSGYALTGRFEGPLLHLDHVKIVNIKIVYAAISSGYFNLFAQIAVANK